MPAALVIGALFVMLRVGLQSQAFVGCIPTLQTFILSKPSYL